MNNLNAKIGNEVYAEATLPTIHQRIDNVLTIRNPDSKWKYMNVVNISEKS